MTIVAQPPSAIRVHIAEALAWADAQRMIDVGIHLDQALIAFDAAVEQAEPRQVLYCEDAHDAGVTPLGATGPT